jgi:hypothetical protein
MGVAAYNRGTAALSRDVDSKSRPVHFLIMDRLNALPKYPDAGRPLKDIEFRHDGKMWWALDPVKGWAGFGFWYPTLGEAVRRWRVSVVGWENGVWKAVRI